MANVMSLKKLQNKPSRSGFDLSKRVLMTAKVGELLPVYCKEVIPGDSFKINVKSFTRTRPVNTAAFTRFKEYIDFVFVPTNLLWNKFNTFVTQMVDNGQKASSITGNVTLSDEHPYFTLQQLVTMMTTLNGSTGSNFFGIKRYNNTRKLLQYLGYGDVNPYIADGAEMIDNVKLNPFPLLAYQKAYYDYFRNSQWEDSRAAAFNIDYLTGAAGTNNLPLSSIDILNDHNSMFELRYANWNKDYFMGLLPSAQYGNSASVNLDSLDLLGDYVPMNAISMLAGTANTSGSFSTLGQQASTAAGTQLEYSIGSRKFDFTLSEHGIRTLRQSMGLPYSDNQTSLTSAFTILALRQAESLQKWKEITQSSQQDYKSQLEAHWNVSVSDAYSDRCKWLGGVSNTINIDPVVNQNITGDNASNVAGNATGVNDGFVSFDSKLHGYIIGIYHCVPLLDYSLKTGIRKQNLKTTASDYAIPEFDKTGMVAVPMIELTNTVSTTDNLIGYAPRYYDYKTDYDEVLGGFQDSEFSEWTAPVSQAYINNYLGAGLIRNTAIDYRFMKVNPSIVDSIFGVQADDTFSTDQLMINAFFDVKAVRNLDYDGLPY